MEEKKQGETTLKMKMAKASRTNCGGRNGKFILLNNNKHVANKEAP